MVPGAHVVAAGGSTLAPGAVVVAAGGTALVPGVTVVAAGGLAAVPGAIDGTARGSAGAWCHRRRRRQHRTGAWRQCPLAQHPLKRGSGSIISGIIGGRRGQDVVQELHDQRVVLVQFLLRFAQLDNGVPEIRACHLASSSGFECISYQTQTDGVVVVGLRLLVDFR